MPERQRPRETARALLNSLSDKLVEQSETLEEISRVSSDDCIDLRSGHSRRRQQCEIDLHSRSRWNGAIKLVLRGDLLARLEIDLETERRLRPDRRVESELTGGADFGTANGNLP